MRLPLSLKLVPSRLRRYARPRPTVRQIRQTLALTYLLPVMAVPVLAYFFVVPAYGVGIGWLAGLGGAPVALWKEMILGAVLGVITLGTMLDIAHIPRLAERLLVHQHRYCLSCQYDRAGLRLDARCPECGRAARIGQPDWPVLVRRRRPPWWRRALARTRAPRGGG